MEKSESGRKFVKRMTPETAPYRLQFCVKCDGFRYHKRGVCMTCETEHATRKNYIPMLALVFALLISTGARAEAITPERATACIVGEAENQGADGMLALAHALHNRGYTRGVYGCERKSKTATRATYQQARKAWDRVPVTKDPTNGATHWGNMNDIEKFAPLSWYRSAYDLITIKSHTFFKLRKPKTKKGE